MTLTKEQTKTINDLNLSYGVELLEVISYSDVDTVDELADINDNGCIDELIDSMIDVYYHDLRAWAVDNYNYIEDALEAFGTSNDWHKDIQMGQYMELNEGINEELHQIINALS